MTDQPNGNGSNGKSWAVRLGDRLSALASDLFAHPYMQIGVILFCMSWFAVRLPTDLLTAALSILAITLTQMVLNRQNDREADAHRRDVAMHAKLDELLLAMKGARDEMAGIEELDEKDIQDLKQAAQAIDAAGSAAGDSAQRAAAKKTIVNAAKTASKKDRNNRAKSRAARATGAAK